MFKVNKVFQYMFPLKHSLIREEDGINAIQKTFFNYYIENAANLYVVKKENNVYLIKIFGATTVTSN